MYFVSLSIYWLLTEKYKGKCDIPVRFTFNFSDQNIAYNLNSANWYFFLSL